MRVIKIRNVIIGEGMPKVCVPLVGESREQILDAAKCLKKVRRDLVEWRADWFKDVCSVGKVMEIAVELREILAECPVLFTFRTKGEGGQQDIGAEKYAELLQDIATTGLVDLMDVEAFGCQEPVLRDIISTAHKNEVVVIGSTHHFQITPPRAEMVKMMRRLQEFGVDIPKLAVMPNSRQDVLELLAATLEMKQKYSDRPLITMSMAADGVISRIAGEFSGSDITFGSAGRASAPGQLPSEELYQALEIVHRGMCLQDIK